MNAVIYTAPASEPVTLGEIKTHLRLSSGSLADNIDSTQSIAPGSKAIANNYTTHVGAAVDVLGYQAIVNLISGTNEATGTVDCKIQESDDSSTWTDVTSGAFTQVTTANDNATQEKAYTGTKRYIRTVAKVLLAACVFGTEVVRLAPTSIEDDLLTSLIETSRDSVEEITRRALITQTWDYYLTKFPKENFIKLPFGNLQSVTSVKYKDTDGTETTMTVTTEYLVETNGDQCGRIVLPYGITWPSVTLYPSNPISIRFVCGYGTASSVPEKVKTAIKLMVEDIYDNRQGELKKVAEILLYSTRLWDEFE